MFKQLFFIAITLMLHFPVCSLCPPQEPKLLLIVGCGRSGTEYMADLLSRSKIRVRHERIGPEGTVSWPMTVNSLSPWGPENKDTFTHCFHQVRNPLHVITSWYVNLPNLQNDEWKFVRQHMPEINEDDPLIVQCAKYWYYWNLMSEFISEWTYKIEDFDNIVDEFEARLGRQVDRQYLKKLPKNKNKWKNTSNKLTWEMLKENLPPDLYDNIMNMAQRYGYEVDSA